jgi:CheY-like chemotaxis protein
MQKPPVVLIVEDDEDNRVIYSTALRWRGYQVLEAANGQQGLAMATQHQPDLVLIDVRMPLMDGLQLRNELQAAADTRHIPAFAITAGVTPDEMERARATGFDLVLTKPLDPRDLIRAIANHFGEPDEQTSNR